MRPFRSMSVLALFTAAVSALADPSPAISVEKPWSRATPPGATTGAGYLTVVNRGKDADRLVGVSSTVAAHTELHLMSMKGGVMSMRELTEGLVVPAQGNASLAPGGTHLMFLELRAPLTAGQKVPVVLRFEKAGEVNAVLEVMPMGSKGPGQ